MIHYDFFQTYNLKEQHHRIQVTPDEVSEENWQQFLSKNNISGKLTQETTNSAGDLIREYSKAGKHVKASLLKDKQMVELEIKTGNLPNKIVGFHRIRGYEGPVQYHLYAILLDVVGLSLIIFAVTGVIMWLELLKNDITAWVILIMGLLYVTAVITYFSVV